MKFCNIPTYVFQGHLSLRHQKAVKNFQANGQLASLKTCVADGRAVSLRYLSFLLLSSSRKSKSEFSVVARPVVTAIVKTVLLPRDAL